MKNHFKTARLETVPLSYVLCLFNHRLTHTYMHTNARTLTFVCGEQVISDGFGLERNHPEILSDGNFLFLFFFNRRF